MAVAVHDPNPVQHLVPHTSSQLGFLPSLMASGIASMHLTGTSVPVHDEPKASHRFVVHWLAPPDPVFPPEAALVRTPPTPPVPLATSEPATPPDPATTRDPPTPPTPPEPMMPPLPGEASATVNPTRRPQPKLATKMIALNRTRSGRPMPRTIPHRTAKPR
jgi:hypothetical protein